MYQTQSDSLYVEKIVQINRVAKKTQGGNRIGFSVVSVVGDRQGKVGVGLGKAPTVSAAIEKANNYAKKHLITVAMRHTTIPYRIQLKKGAAVVLLKPAPPGTGVIAGGAVRAVVEAAGIHNILTKSLGTSNPHNVVKAVMEGLSKLSTLKRIV